MKRSLILLLVAGVLAIVALGSAVVYKVSAPNHMRIAVGPVGSQDTKLVVAILQTFAREKHPIRLKLVPSDGPVASAEMLRDGKVDLALVRSDGGVPANAATVAIVHRDALMIMVSAASNIRSIADLRGRKVGAVRSFNLNRRLFELLLIQNGIEPSQVTIVNLRPGDVRTAAQEGLVDAILSVGPVTSPAVRAIYDDFTLPLGGPPVILPIHDAEAIAQQNPLLEHFTILRGTFGGSPARPAENIDTLAVTHRLVADRSLKESAVAELTKALFEIRQSVAAEVPGAASIEEPNAEKTGALVIHPGASAYFDGEQKSFIEQYGEWIYLGVGGVSLLGSLIAALFSRHLSHRRPAGSGEIDRMLLLLRNARNAKSIDELDRIQQDADDAFGRTVERAAEAEIDEAVLSAFTIALSEVRTAIEERRKDLSQDAFELAG